MPRHLSARGSASSDDGLAEWRRVRSPGNGDADGVVEVGLRRAVRQRAAFEAVTLEDGLEDKFRRELAHPPRQDLDDGGDHLAELIPAGRDRSGSKVSVVDLEDFGLEQAA